MKQKLMSLLKESLKFLIIITVALNLVSLYKSRDIKKDDLIMENIQLLDGINHSFKSRKPLVIHFWAVWCPVCKIENPAIQKLSKDYEVVTVAVNSGSDEKIKKFMTENKLDFKTVNDNDGNFSKKFNINVYPTTLIYDKNRKLVFSETGYTSTPGLRLRLLWASF